MDPVVIPFAFPGVPGVRAAFQTRLGGVSHGAFGGGNIVFKGGDDEANVRENRRRLREQLGFAHWVEAIQVHGTRLCFELEPGELPKADGLATSRPGHALVIKTADCQPLLLAHQSGAYVAALHVGWRGNEQGFPQSGVAAFCERYGVEPSELWAVRGPSLGPAASQFVNFVKEWRPGFEPFFDPVNQTMDLWRLTRHQLQSAGLRPERILGLDLCTWSLPEHFFSYRREHHSGRQASFVWIEG